MKPRLLSLFVIGALLALLGTPGAAQDGFTVTGSIRDAHVGAPVVGADVMLSGARRGAQTDGEGRFQLTSVPPGTHTLQIRQLGYNPMTVTITVTGQLDLLPVLLTPRPHTLDGVTARGQAIRPKVTEFEARRARHHAGGRFFTRADLAQKEASTLANVLRGGVPGTQIVRDPSRGALYLASGRQAAPGALRRPPRPCYAQIYLDGVRIYGQGSEDSQAAQPPDLNMFLVENLEGVEFYASAASTPVQFRTGTATCGTLVLWTRAA